MIHLQIKSQKVRCPAAATCALLANFSKPVCLLLRLLLHRTVRVLCLCACLPVCLSLYGSQLACLSPFSARSSLSPCEWKRMQITTGERSLTHTVHLLLIAVITYCVMAACLSVCSSVHLSSGGALSATSSTSHRSQVAVDGDLLLLLFRSFVLLMSDGRTKVALQLLVSQKPHKPRLLAIDVTQTHGHGTLTQTGAATILQQS